MPDGGASWAFEDWARQDARARTPRWKRAIYKVARPLLDLEGRRHLSPSALARWRPDFVFTRRGLPLEDRRTLAVARTSLSDATVLVQGTGNGWDVISWAELRPRAIIAVDATAFATWEGVARHCRDRLGVRVAFHEAPLERCTFVADRSVDLCASDAVLEHVRDMDGMLAETTRVLAPSGRVYASIGPLWYSAGGDHFTGRAPLEDAFAHIDRDADAYRAFFQRHRRAVEDFQSGGRYVEIDLFSKLTTDDYLAAFRAARLEPEYLAIQIAHRALELERRAPERVNALLARHAGRITRDDLRTFGLVVRLRRSAGSASDGLAHSGHRG